MAEEASLHYHIAVEKIRRMGRYNHAAKAVFSKNVDTSKFRIQAPLFEEWGASEDEVKARVRKGIEEWGKKVGRSVTEV